MIENLNVWNTNADVLTGKKMNELKSRVTIEKPDIIIISEVLPKNSIYETTDANLTLDGYELIRSENWGSRGIIIYTAIHLNASKIDTSTKFEESIWCNIKTTNSENIIVGGIYRSPSITPGSDVNNKQLLKLLSEVSKMKHDHIIITGDFNLKKIDWVNREVHTKEGSYEHKMYDTVNDLFLHETVKQCTRFRGTDTPSALDWLLTENPDRVVNISIEPPLGSSDHCIISAKYNCYNEQHSEDVQHNYSYYNGDFNAMREELGQLDWQQCLNNKNVQQSWDTIRNKINGLIEKHVPKKRYLSSKKPAWYGRDIGNISKLKKKAWSNYKKNPSPELWAQYTKQRNLLTHTIENTKANYENKIASEVKDNPKKFWNYIKKKTKSKGKIVDLLDKEGNLVSDDAKKAEVLNDHFASVFTKENTDNIPTLDIDLDDITLIEEVTVTNETFTKHLQKLKLGKASGPDGINSRVLKELAYQVAPGLKILFELSMAEGKLPKDWKDAHVIALFKKGSKRQPNNYRPVSLTSICCKVFEKITRDKIVKHLEENGLLHKDQHGFRGGRSCTTQLLEVMEIWTKWLDLGLPWDVIYTDFSKAFDSVPHQRLLNKVHAYGIRGKIYNWIKDFLAERHQRVVIGNDKSSWKPVTSGIPQGSVLGPILFTIFINDMPDVVKSFMKLFADDAKLFRAIESMEDIEMIQDDINKLSDWSFKWQLPLNIIKCKAIHYGKKNPNSSYSMNNSALNTDTTEKDVGVTFDESLEFRLHIKNMIAKANSRVGLIKRSFSKLNIKTFKLVYKSLVRPILEYCSVIWSPIYKGDINEIEKVQRRATKIVSSIRNLSYPKRLKALDIPTLVYRRQRTDMLQVFRIINNDDKIDTETFFEYNTTATRGHPFQLFKPRCNSAIRLNSFSHRVIEPWNKLDEKVVTCKKLNPFKNALKEDWKNHPYKFNPHPYSDPESDDE